MTDDCVEAKNQLDEYIRITADTMVFTARPKVMKSQPFRSLEEKLPVQMELCYSIGNIQVDNQVYRSGQYDFPVVLKGHEDYQAPKLTLDQSDRVLKEYKEKGLLRIGKDTLQAISFIFLPLDGF